VEYLSTIKDAPETERAGAKVLKEFSAVVSKGAESKSLTFQASSESVDRHGDRVIQSGLDVANFIKTGAPILYAHQYSSLPVGRATSVSFNSKGLEVSIVFADHAFAQEVYNLALGGFLKSVSIGFIAGDYVANDVGGYDYKTSELIEISVVPVPSQVDAIRLRSLAADQISEADFKTLLAATDQVLNEFEKRIGGGDEEISEETFRALLAGANKQIDDWAYRNLGWLAKD